MRRSRIIQRNVDLQFISALSIIVRDKCSLLLSSFLSQMRSTVYYVSAALRTTRPQP